jgi:hypothetical protein
LNLQPLESLQRLILNSVAESFFARLSARQAVLYEEARAMAFSAPWGNPEAESVFPINRRALMENEVRRSARENKLSCDDSRHLGDNCGYVLVQAGKLRITTHHVDKPTRFVPPCRSRQQNAAVNDWLDTPYFEELLQELPPRLGDADSANVYLLHGLIVEKRAGKSYPSLFMRMAFPDAELARYVCNYDVLDLLQLYGADGESVAGSPNGGGGSLPDNARPVLNIKPEKEAVTGEPKKRGG